MTILQAAYHEVALANSRLRTENDVMRACLAQREAEIAKLRAQITDPRTVTMTRTRYEEYQAAEERLAAYEGQLTAEEMRERCAVIARAERHNREGSKSFFERGAISMSVHVEDAIRALPTKREVITAYENPTKSKEIG